LIPVADVESNTVVFVGAMQGIIDDSSNGQQRINNGLNAIFGEWPN
jgi:hypothetical protein